MQIIIGIAGKIGSGKSTAAKLLVDHAGFREYTFAERLKQVVHVAFGTERRHLWGTQADKSEIIPEWGVSGRALLQVVGTELFRNELQRQLAITGIWERTLMNEIERDEAERVVISDVRFPSEAAEIKRRGGCIIRIHGNRARLEQAAPPRRSRQSFLEDVAKLFSPSPERAQHASETQDFAADYNIGNHGSLDDLWRQLEFIARRVQHQR